MISVFLMGGLGNQLFQIFTALAQAIEQNVKIVFPYTDKLHVGVVRPTYWTNFLNSLSIFTTANKDTGVTNEDLNQFQVFHETKFSYNIIPHFNNVNTILAGYFQSWKYFHKYREQIFQLIRLYDILEANRTEFQEYFLENPAFNVSMHFRLGDYKHKQDFHPVMPYEYYETALNKCIEVIDQDSIVTVLYFCEAEDNDYVTEIIRRLKEIHTKIHFQKVDDAIPDWKQLLIMSNCNANIIANSTYSWWGAYLSNRNRVYYPCKWFGPNLQHNNLDDLFLDEWTKIDF